MSGVNRVDDNFAQFRGGVNVDFPRHFNDVERIDFTFDQRQVHEMHSTSNRDEKPIRSSDCHQRVTASAISPGFHALGDTYWVKVAEVLAAWSDRIVHAETRPAREAVVEPWPDWVPPEIRAIFASQGVDVLWAHQAEALRLLELGENVVVSTGTGSGKSLVHQVPLLRSLSEGRTGSAFTGYRRPSVLYLSPTKALAADQLARLPNDLHWLRAATVDGDNTREERNWARDHANVVLANPDVLHYSLLPAHEHWHRFFAGLRYVVVDEAHQYRGVFGSHVAQVLRRLRRVAAHHGASPQFIFASATLADPAANASQLLGLPVRAVVDDASAAGPFQIAFWQPPLIPGADDRPPTVRRSATNEAAELLAALVTAGFRTLVFVQSRAVAERLARSARERLEGSHPGSGALIASYRSGYLPEERRELEAGLRTGELRGLVSTSALELGIDVAGLDAVISVGFPGTRAGLWQRFGRAGRAGAEGTGILIARDEPLDAHVVHNPESVLGAPLEQVVFDPNNPYVLGPHLAAAAQEVPLTEADLSIFGPRAAEGVEALTSAGLLRRRTNGWFWTSPDRASSLADLRSSGGQQVTIVEEATGRLVGTVDAGTADRDVHQDAVYTHLGQDYIVTAYEPDDHTALVREAEPNHTTMAHSDTSISIIDIEDSARWGPATVAWGSVEVRGRVTGFDIHERRTGRSLGQGELDLPERTLVTKAVWWSLPPALVANEFAESRMAGAAHAAEHAAIGLLPLIATCDRWDIGGVSTALHPDTGQLTVFVHDGHPGGAGFAERGFLKLRKWLALTRSTISSCECVDGCPACIVSPKCGNRNEPLDKEAAVLLLDLLLAS